MQRLAEFRRIAPAFAMEGSHRNTRLHISAILARLEKLQAGTCH
jgi:hypothetical protein